MKISYNWIKSYVPDLPAVEKLTDVFTFHICEVESVEKIGDDSVFDIKILPDRAHDLLCHRGVARDLAGILGIKYNNLKWEVPTGSPTDLKIKIDTDNCRRYMGRIVRNVKVEQSSTWMVEHLASMGQRSINNLVDATNIVMFDRGNPIHVFDLDKLSGGITVRQARDGETLTTLDNKDVKLNSKNMVIADDERALAIAGIKGGKFAEVDENTKNIIIEVANFDPTSVRKTAKEINIYTDAVKRFENDLSQEVASDAMNDMAALVLEMCKDAKVEEVVDVYPQKQIEKKLTFSIEKISKILGMNVLVDDVEKIFKNYEIPYEVNGNEFTFVVPKERLDLNIDEDMAEEIGRVIGYDKIEAVLPEINFKTKADDTFEKLQTVRNKMLLDGYSEVMNYAFCDKGEVEVLASASDKKFLRTNLSDALKESLKLNQLNLPLLEMKDVKIFEIGTVFKKDGEEMHVAFNVKKPASTRGGSSTQGGEIKELTLDEFCKDMGDVEVAFKELINSIPKLSEDKFKMWSPYPFISRDVAVWVPEGEGPEKLKNLLRENATELCVKEPYMFDSFTKPARTAEGVQSGGDGRTSYGFRLVFQSYDRTLKDEEVNEIMTKISHKISENSSWEIR